jgi:hypothetical protein
MSETTEPITIYTDDEVLFRLREGRRPLVYSDTMARVSYETGISVMHMGTVWAVREVDGVEAFELDDGTVVAVADVDPASVAISPTAAPQQMPGA